MKILEKVEDLNPHQYKTDGLTEANLLVLYQRLKQVEALFIAVGGSKFFVNSGLRSDAQQKQLIADGLSLATKSKHLIGAAADIADVDGFLKTWLKDQPGVLVEASLWCEAAEYTQGWCHFQIIPPGSGRRWFIP